MIQTFNYHFEGGIVRYAMQYGGITVWHPVPQRFVEQAWRGFPLASIFSGAFERYGVVDWRQGDGKLALLDGVEQVMPMRHVPGQTLMFPETFLSQSVTAKPRQSPMCPVRECDCCDNKVVCMRG
jgi:hypothetical protein